ncbi:hypothetical protein RTBOTA2_004896 [Rhodotorula toruloides]|nr:hypothetical protein RTBOTA2_004896 [Rhodotorula toruloides]
METRGTTETAQGDSPGRSIDSTTRSPTTSARRPGFRRCNDMARGLEQQDEAAVNRKASLYEVQGEIKTLTMLPSHALEIPAAPRTPSHAVLALPSPRLTLSPCHHPRPPADSLEWTWRRAQRLDDCVRVAQHRSAWRLEDSVAVQAERARSPTRAYRCVNPRPGCSCSTPHALHFEAGWCSG